MQIIARKHLVQFGLEHPEARPSLLHWERLVKAGKWHTMAEAQAVFPKAKVLNGERMRFEIHRDDYRLIVAFDLPRQVAFIKFIGAHAAYDRIDALTVSLF